MRRLGIVLLRARAWKWRSRAAVLLAAGAVLGAAPEAAATTADRPAFASPFACGQAWFARTYRGHPSFAVDWNLPGGGEADYGQPVLAGAPGVATVRQHPGYGNMVTIDHGGGWTSLYAHLSSIVVANGQAVERDTVVGHVGNTGRSDGSHLHHEQSLNGVRQQVAIDGAVVFAAWSSRSTSYVSANCRTAVARRAVCRRNLAVARVFWARECRR
jgi:Peptidase family M23